MKQTISFIAILLIILTAITCKDDNPVDPPEPPIPAVPDTLTISVKQVSHRSISINIKSTDNGTGRLIGLRRITGTDISGSHTLVSSYSSSLLDTTIIDDNDGSGLELDTEYGYYAVRLDSLGMPTDTSNVVTAKTLAATSHEYEWQEIIIGEWQSVLYDVWGTDENNVYAVGSVRLNDTLYGIIKWNGTEWLPEKKVGGVNGIFGFSENDIWAVGGAVEHYNGIKWKRIDAETINYRDNILDSVLYSNRTYTSLWGTSSNNLYLTGANGKIIHWNGNKASIVYQGSNVPLTDIYGVNNNFILAAGSALADPGIGLSNETGSWELVEGIPFSTTRLKSVYITDRKKYYIFGERNYESNKVGLMEILKNTPATQNKIRGNEIGELVSVGNGFSLNHFNGEDWKDYSYELNKPNSAFYGVYLTTDKIFAVGGLGNQAAIYIGIKKE